MVVYDGKEGRNTLLVIVRRHYWTFLMHRSRVIQVWKDGITGRMNHIQGNSRREKADHIASIGE